MKLLSGTYQKVFNHGECSHTYYCVGGVYLKFFINVSVFQNQRQGIIFFKDSGK